MHVLSAPCWHPRIRQSACPVLKPVTAGSATAAAADQVGRLRSSDGPWAQLLWLSQPAAGLFCLPHSAFDSRLPPSPTHAVHSQLPSAAGSVDTPSFSGCSSACILATSAASSASSSPSLSSFCAACSAFTICTAAVNGSGCAPHQDCGTQPGTLLQVTGRTQPAQQSEF